MKSFIVAVCSVLLLIPLSSQAETVVRTGDSVSIAADQRVASDFYVAANLISMSGAVDGDMYALGGTVTVNGDIAEDLTVVSGTTQVHATVTDDVRVLGGEVVIAESVGGDVFVFGGVLKVLSSASIGGDVYFFGGEAEIAGPVAGSVVGTFDRVRIDAPVGGSVSVRTNRGLTLGSRASIAGDVSYRSAVTLVRAPEATVEGEVLQETLPAGAGFDTRSAVIYFLITLFSALTVYLLGRTRIQTGVTLLPSTWTTMSLWGFAVLLGVPVVASLLLVTMLGSLLGIALLVGYFAFVLLALLVAPIVAGSIIFYAIKKEIRVDIPVVVSGVVLVQVLWYLPFVGGLGLLVLLVLSMGVLLQYARLRL